MERRAEKAEARNTELLDRLEVECGKRMAMENELRKAVERVRAAKEIATRAKDLRHRYEKLRDEIDRADPCSRIPMPTGNPHDLLFELECELDELDAALNGPLPGHPDTARLRRICEVRPAIIPCITHDDDGAACSAAMDALDAALGGETPEHPDTARVRELESELETCQHQKWKAHRRCEHIVDHWSALLNAAREETATLTRTLAAVREVAQRLRDPEDAMSVALKLDALLDSSPLPPTDAPRWPQVDALAVAMKERLDANAHKPGWRGDYADDLIERIEDETGELRRAVAAGKPPAEILRESADVANFAMMVADIQGSFTAAPRPAEQGEDHG